VARVFVISLLVLFVLRTIVNKTWVIRRSPVDLPLLAFASSALLSAIFAYNQNVAVFGTYSRYDGALTIMTYVLLFWLSLQVLNGPEDARTLLRVLLASGYLVAAVAILQSVTASVGQGILVPAYGTLGQQNVLGAFLAMLSPLAFRELVDAASWSKRVVAINLLIVIGAGLVLTLSRSAWLGILLAAVVLAVGSRHNIRIGVAAISLGLLGAIVIAGFSLAGGRQVERQIQTRAMTVFDPGAWGPRPAIWRDSIGLIASRPVFGYGPDNFGLVYPRFQASNLGRSQVDKAHSESLQVAATQGLVGLAVYLLVLAAFVRAFWRGRHRNGALEIFAGWLAYQVTLQLNFSALAASLPFWIFAAAAMQAWGATSTIQVSVIRRRRLATAAGALAIVALATLAVIGTVFPYRADAQLLAAVRADLGGRWAAAKAASAEARALVPSESVYAVEAGNIAFEHSDWGAASAAYEDAARLGTFNPLVYRNLALADRNLGRIPQALAAARKAVELDRFDPANEALLAEFATAKP
jgi:putative inorganic carbon (HCO3(-)) transporter